MRKGDVTADVPPARRDVLVVGSSAGGLSAAVTAASLGLNVIVVEKEAVFGGTTAWSGGWLWIPRNPLAVAAGIVEDAEAPRTYLRHELGPHYDETRVEAFLEQGPRMIDFFQRETAVMFIDGNAIPDFHGASPGAREGGRSVCAAPFDARELGPRFAQLRPPLDLISPWGMGIASGTELRHFLNAMRNWRSFAYVTRRVVWHMLDLVVHRRGMKLVNGNALVARLARSAFDRGVDLRVSAPVRQLLIEEGRVVGAVVQQPGGDTEIRANRGVVLACGGFPHDPVRIAQLFAHAPTGREHRSAAPASNTGDGLRLGEAVGAVVKTDLRAGRVGTRVARAQARWHRRPFSASGRARETGPHRRYACRLALRRRGRLVLRLHGGAVRRTARGCARRGVAVCDHRFIRRYGLGHAMPAPLPLGPSLRSGYLKRGRTIAELARACGLPEGALAAAVETYNRDACEGRDPAFGRGDTPYDRAGGDPLQRPNPNVAPVEHAPYYAVKVVPGSLGTFAGLRTDADARVLDARGMAIPGLYACGADMASVMGGRYPSCGITLGPAMTFGYIAAHHLATATPAA